MRQLFFRSSRLSRATLGSAVLALGMGLAAPVHAQPNGTGKKTPAATHTVHGHVSFYGAAFAGRTTANGERFNPGEMTMAHKSLPFGTLVRVTNPQNNHSVVVRVNDRGPYFGNRIADLSQEAAARLRMITNGVIVARLEIIGMAQRLRDLPPQAAAAAVAATQPMVDSLVKAVTPAGAVAPATPSPYTAAPGAAGAAATTPGLAAVPGVAVAATAAASSPTPSPAVPVAAAAASAPVAAASSTGSAL